MRIEKYLLLSACLAVALLASAVSALAQEAPQAQPQPHSDPIIIERNSGVIVGTQASPVVAASGDNLAFRVISSEMTFDNRVVKGAPYSADAVTETVQTLGDGNRIVRKNTTKIFRDGDGRTRTEQTLRTIGAFAVAGEPPQTIFINDPVSGTSYVLDSRTHIARKLMFHFDFRFGPNAPGARGSGANAAAPDAARRAAIERAASEAVVLVPGAPVAVAGNTTVFSRTTTEHSDRVKTEQLGRQTVEGVEAEGTRTTYTIPTGEIGNEREIQIVSERWYSPELQTVVMSKRSDPLSGDTTYRLTNINRGEQPRTLFELPSDYTLRESAPAPNVQIRSIRRPN